MLKEEKSASGGKPDGWKKLFQAIKDFPLWKRGRGTRPALAGWVGGFRRSGISHYACMKNRSVPIFSIFLTLPLMFFVVVFLSGVVYAEKNDNDKVDVATEITNLKSKNISQKLNAINKLSKSKDKRAKNELIKELKTETTPYIKARIVESLAADHDETTSKEVENLLKTDKNSDVRYSAAYSLGYAKNVSIVPTLMETFLNEKEDLGVRLQSANALTNYPATEEIYQCFLKGLKNPNPAIRSQSITSISLSFATTHKDRIVPLLKEMLGDKEESVRSVAKERLEILGIKQ